MAATLRLCTNEESCLFGVAEAWVMLHAAIYKEPLSRAPFLRIFLQFSNFLCPTFCNTNLLYLFCYLGHTLIQISEKRQHFSY